MMGHSIDDRDRCLPAKHRGSAQSGDLKLPGVDMKKLFELLVVLSLGTTSLAHAQSCPGVTKNVHVHTITYDGTYYPFFSISEDTSGTRLSLSLAKGMDTPEGQQLLSLLLLAKGANYPISFSCANGDVSNLKVDFAS